MYKNTSLGCFSNNRFSDHFHREHQKALAIFLIEKLRMLPFDFQMKS